MVSFWLWLGCCCDTCLRRTIASGLTSGQCVGEEHTARRSQGWALGAARFDTPRTIHIASNHRQTAMAGYLFACPCAILPIITWVSQPARRRLL